MGEPGPQATNRLTNTASKTKANICFFIFFPPE
jgi:hypothetical protein